MQLLQIGLDHGTADVTVRERLAFQTADLPAVLADLRQLATDAVVLSTCNRVEIYLLAEQADSCADRVIIYLADRSGLGESQVRAATRVRVGSEVVRHLCRVATGLESMILGEPEIAGQVRTAQVAANVDGVASVVLRRLFDDALRVAGQVRADSGIGRHAVSVSTAAIRLAERTMGGLEGRVALVIGAGSVGRSAARVLAQSGASSVIVSSRRIESARSVATEFGCQATTIDSLPAALVAADLVIGATAAPHTVVHVGVVSAAMAARPDRPLVLVDVAVPRDIEPEIRRLPGCTLFDVDDLKAAREASLASRKLAAVDAEAYIERTVGRFMSWLNGRMVASVVADLVAHAEQVRQREVERGLSLHGATTERERALVEATSAAIVKKLLHAPIVELKRRGAGDDGLVWVRALGELFALSRGVETGGAAAPMAAAPPSRAEGATR
jgi:glutamyl-tRNA reductase